MAYLAAFAVAFSMAQQTVPTGAASCLWEGEVTPASNSDGHRLRVVFVDTDGQVALSLGEDLVFDRVLRTEQNGSGYSGAIQCRLSGQRWITVDAFGQRTMIGLWMDEPNLVTVQASNGQVRASVDQTDQPPLLD
jgi:hypothetical protein